jgi:hypothetical protein
VGEFYDAVERELGRERGVADVSPRVLRAWRECGGIDPPPSPRLRGFRPDYQPPSEYIERVLAFRELVREQRLGLQHAVLILTARGDEVESRHVRRAFVYLADSLARKRKAARDRRLRGGSRVWRMIERDLRAFGHGEDAERLARSDTRTRREKVKHSRRMLGQVDEREVAARQPIYPRVFLAGWREKVGARAPDLVENATDAQLVEALREGRKRALSIGEIGRRIERGLTQEGAEAVTPLHALDVLAGNPSGGEREPDWEQVRDALDETRDQIFAKVDEALSGLSEEERQRIRATLFGDDASSD